MTEKQEHLLQLFRELDEICKKNNLRYVMAGGTAIGVVRNEGFIPWDDDVDIYMPRDDWNKLVEISGSVLPEHRALQCVDVDRSYTNTFPRYVATDSCALHKHQIIGRDSAGEIIDVDAYTGGFNLQIAWATGRLAGLSAAAKEFQKPEDAT